MADNNVNIPQQDEESEWSLSSLEDLKGLNLDDIKDEEEGFDHKQASLPPIQKNKLEPKYPPHQELTPTTKLFEVGKVIARVAQLLIVQAVNSNNLVDMDNWLFNQNKQCLGFVIDIFGRVDNPYYAVQLLPNIIQQLPESQSLCGLNVFYAEGCKTLTEEDIRSIKEKSSVNKQMEQDSSSSSSAQQSDDEDGFRSNVVMHKRQRAPKRRGSFEQPPYHERQRTRQKKTFRRFEPEQNQRRRHHDNRPYHEVNRDRQHNQNYLESMYNTYYNQMMQLYNGQNGMPLPKPPVFPFFQQPPQQVPFPQNYQQNQNPPNVQRPQNPTFYYNPQQAQFPPFPQNQPPK